MPTVADCSQHLVATVVGIDPFYLGARCHDIADAAFADVEDANDDLLLRLLQNACFPTGPDQKLQLLRRMQGFLAGAGAQPA